MSRLRELRLRDVALIPQAFVEFDDGFIALTGESGAGKSLCISALRFALGAKPNTDLIARGAERAQVTAVFDSVPELEEKLSGLGVPTDDLLVLAREINASGRSTCRINGALVSQSVLREVGEILADVTVQGTSQRLLQHSFQREILDAFAGGDHAQLLRQMAETYRQWQGAVRGHRDLVEMTRRSVAEIESAKQIVADLEPLQLRIEEENELKIEANRLRHATALRTAALQLALSVSGDERQGGAVDEIGLAVNSLESLRHLDPVLGEMADTAAALMEQLHDLALDARRFSGQVEVDTGRAEYVEERLDVIARVTRRFGSIEVASHELEKAKNLCDVAGDGSALQESEKKLKLAAKEAADAAVQLSESRRRAARKLELHIDRLLHQLQLPSAKFKVIVERESDGDGLEMDGATWRCTAQGADRLDFRLAANRGDIPLPLGQGPSGGELSRLSLALAAAASAGEQPLLVLDEVDTGIGGETAARVGELLAASGAHRQVLAITHRPEIAARAHSHLLVEKHEGQARPETTVKTIWGPSRVNEVARLMSGEPTKAALARAKELLKNDGDRSNLIGTRRTADLAGS